MSAQVYYDQAAAQLNPGYDQQQTAIQSQIPAIQNLYSSLNQGLDSSARTESQNILEGASARGVLRSSLPTDLQTSLAQTTLQEKGKLAVQQAQDISGVNEKLGTLNINRVQSINDLAHALQAGDLSEREFQFKVEEANRNFELEKQKLAVAASSGSTKEPSQFATTMGAANALAAELRGVAGKDGYVSPQDYAAAAREWGSAGFGDFDKYFTGFKNPQNKAYQYYLTQK